jgi:hypothetical protein
MLRVLEKVDALCHDRMRQICRGQIKKGEEPRALRLNCQECLAGLARNPCLAYRRQHDGLLSCLPACQ